MKKIVLEFEKKKFKELENFLSETVLERNVFLFLEYKENGEEIIFKVKDILYIKDNKEKYSLETEDNIVSGAIKKAWGQNLSLGEIHSHPFSEKDTTFSYFDISELDKFVPYVFWRLKNKPYVALVFGKKDFDARVWIEESSKVFKLDEIAVGNKVLKPTNICFEEGYLW